MPDWDAEDWHGGGGTATGQAEEPARGLGVRRAFLGGVAGVALLVGPVGLAQAIVPENDVDVAIGGKDSANVFAALGDETDVVTEVSQDRLNQALAAQPATVAEKPAAPTTTSSTTTTTTTEPPDLDGETPPPDSGGGVGDPSSYATWDALAECESGGNWSTNTGNGYYGGLQFALSTWQSLGGEGYPHENSRETQIAIAQKLQARSGWGQWPACTRKLGWI